MHINIRSPQKFFDLLTEFLNSFKLQPDVLRLTETRIKTQPLLNIFIPGYRFVHVGTASNAQGVAAYIPNKLKYHFSPNQYSLNNSKCIWQEIKERKLNSKYVLGVVIFCSPPISHPHQSELNFFLDDFSACPFNLTSSSKPFYILGNLNIDASRESRCAVACK